jgi:hypothetical protein
METGRRGHDRMVVGFTTTYAIKLTYATNKTNQLYITEILFSVALTTKHFKINLHVI